MEKMARYPVRPSLRNKTETIASSNASIQAALTLVLELSIAQVIAYAANVLTNKPWAI
jgi:hypothetical protein